MQFFVSYGNQGQVLRSTSSFKLVLQPAKVNMGHVLKEIKIVGRPLVGVACEKQ